MQIFFLTDYCIKYWYFGILQSDTMWNWWTVLSHERWKRKDPKLKERVCLLIIYLNAALYYRQDLNRLLALQFIKILRQTEQESVLLYYFTHRGYTRISSSTEVLAHNSDRIKPINCDTKNNSSHKSTFQHEILRIKRSITIYFNLIIYYYIVQ